MNWPIFAPPSVMPGKVRIDHGRLAALTLHFTWKQVCCVFSEQEEYLRKPLAEVESRRKDSNRASKLACSIGKVSKLLRCQI